MKRFGIDVHIVDAPDEAVQTLRGLHEAEVIELVKTDAMDTELSAAKDEGARRELLEKSGELEEVVGIGIIGRSRIGHARFASKETAVTYGELWAMLWPDYSRKGPETSARRTRTFDTMHIHSAIINNCSGFITRDSDLLKRSEAIWDRFELAVLTPEEVVKSVLWDDPDGS